MPDSSDLKKFSWQLVIVLTLLTLGLLSLTYFYSMQFKKSARSTRESELATIANLKALQVDSWRREHFSTLQNISGGPYFITRALALIKDPTSVKIRQEIQTGLSHLQKNFLGEYPRIAILLSGGKVIFSSPDSPPYVQTRESARLSLEAWTTGKIRFGDLNRDPDSGRISIPVVLPLLVPREKGFETIAVIAIDIDPARTLYPLIQEWPSSSQTAEVLLIERQGRDFLYLSEPRLQKNVAFAIRLPMSRFRRPGFATPIGEEGVIEGTDYRGHSIVGVIKSIPDSPWLIEAKMDIGEINASWSRPIGLISVLIILFVMAAGTALGLFLKRRMAIIGVRERQRWEQALKNQNDFLRVLIDVMPNAAYLKDTHGRLTACNAAFEKLVGLSVGKIVGMTFDAFTSKELAERDREVDRLLFEKPGVQVYESTLKAADGVEHSIIFIKSTYSRPDGRAAGLLGIMIDITQRKRAEEELQQIRRFSDGIVQTMSEGLVLTDSEGKFSFVNPAAAGMLGYSPGEMVEREALSFVAKDQHQVVLQADARRAKGLADRYELDFVHKDGSRRTILVSGGPRFAGVHYAGTMAVMTDITDRKRMEQEIRALSLTDPLTDLYNRRGLEHLGDQQLKIASRLNKRVFILYLDVDNLKHINDTFGHKEGDRVLVDLANILKKNFRDSDIVARTGGDEFVVLAMEAARVDSEMFTKRLQERLGLYNSRAERQGRYTLTLSTGVSTFDPELPSSIDDLISRADSLMYEQKRARKN